MRESSGWKERLGDWEWLVEGEQRDGNEPWRREVGLTEGGQIVPWLGCEGDRGRRRKRKERGRELKSVFWRNEREKEETGKNGIGKWTDLDQLEIRQLSELGISVESRLQSLKERKKGGWRRRRRRRTAARFLVLANQSSSNFKSCRFWASFWFNDPILTQRAVLLVLL